MVDIPHAVESLVTVAFPDPTRIQVGDEVSVWGPSHEPAFSQLIQRGTVVNVADLRGVLKEAPTARCAHGEPRSGWCEACVSDGWGE